MPAGTEPEELRALQRKAYGPHGGALTDIEARRLRELEQAGRSTTPPVEDASSSALPEPTSEPHSTVAEERSSGGGADAAGPLREAEPGAPSVDEQSETPVRPLRRHAAAVVTAALLLAAGTGAGWALFAPRVDGIPLTEDQQQRRAELSADAFDQGSVRAIAERDGALAWYATQDGGDIHCLILDLDEQSQTDCLPSDEIERGLTASLSLPPGDESEEGGVLYATMLLSTTGEPMVGIQRWTSTSMLSWQFEGEELARAESLVAQGYQLGVSIVGTFRGAPVWVADRVSEQGSTLRCLVVDAADAGLMECEPLETAVSNGLRTEALDTDPDQAAVLELKFTTQQTPYLTITAPPPGPPASVVVQAPPGDPIEVSTPDR